MIVPTQPFSTDNLVFLGKNCTIWASQSKIVTIPFTNLVDSFRILYFVAFLECLVVHYNSEFITILSFITKLKSYMCPMISVVIIEYYIIQSVYISGVSGLLIFGYHCFNDPVESFNNSLSIVVTSLSCSVLNFE